MRLNKYLALSIGISRREADDLISSGKVQVNSNPARLGQDVSKDDSVSVKGDIVSPPDEFTYLLIDKPVGYVCSRKSQDDSPTVYSLVPEEYQNLKYVGRLDKDSEGLLLLTDDGSYAFEMTHPKFGKDKSYQVVLDRKMTEADMARVNQGVILDDRPSKLAVTSLGKKTYLVRMSEGRNRQIRRTMAALGYQATQLQRIEFGAYKLSDLGGKVFTEVKKR